MYCMKKLIGITTFILAFFNSEHSYSQPLIPIEQWEGKTILLIGAHPDDDYQSHGTLALLNENDSSGSGVIALSSPS